MKYINIGDGLIVSQLAYGTSHIHHLLCEKKRLQLLKKAYDGGINYFDTARIYGHGIAEKSLGKFLSKYSIPRESLYLTTKFGMNANYIYENIPFSMYMGKVLKKIFNINEFHRSLSLVDIQKSLQSSLRNLQTSYIDIYYLHEPQFDDINIPDDVIRWLREQKEKGTIRHVGLSGDHAVCSELIKKYNVFDILQIHYPSKLALQPKPHVIFGALRGMRSNRNWSEDLLQLIKDESVLLFSTTKEEHLDEILDIEKIANDT